jgi:hypothetical protein
MEAVPGVMASETSVAFTVKVAVPLIDPEVAVIVVEPAAFALAIPPVAMVATLVADEVQVTVPVRSEVLPSLKVPVAVNWSVALVWTDKLTAVT